MTTISTLTYRLNHLGKLLCINVDASSTLMEFACKNNIEKCYIKQSVKFIAYDSLLKILVGELNLLEYRFNLIAVNENVNMGRPIFFVCQPMIFARSTWTSTSVQN